MHIYRDVSQSDTNYKLTSIPLLNSLLNEITTSVYVRRRVQGLGRVP